MNLVLTQLKNRGEKEETLENANHFQILARNSNDVTVVYIIVETKFYAGNYTTVMGERCRTKTVKIPWTHKIINEHVYC